MRSGAHPVDERADILVDLHVCARRELVVGREPRCKRRMGQDVLALRQRLAQRPREVRHPLLGGAVTAVHRSEVLVVDVNAIQAVRLHPLRHRVRGIDGVRARGGGGVGRAECGRDDLDAGVVVFGLFGGLVCGGERGPVACLVEGAGEGEEGQRNDVVPLEERGMSAMSTSREKTTLTLSVDAAGRAPVTQLSE